MSDAGNRPRVPRLAMVVPHLRMGGGELSMVRLAAALARGGVPVDLLVHTLAGAEIAVPPALRLVQLGSSGTLDSVRRLARWLARERPRWLVSAFPHTNVASVAANALARSGCRVLLSEHAPLTLQMRRQRGWRWRALPPLVRWAYPRADAVVAVSRGVHDDLRTLLGPRLPLFTIANPVLLAGEGGAAASAGPARSAAAAGGAEAFAAPAPMPMPAPGAPAAGPAGDRGLAPPAGGTPLHPWLRDPGLRVVLAVSRLSEEKDIPTLLAAFEQLHAARPQARLLLAGGGPLREALAARIAQRGLTAVAALAGPVVEPRAWMQRAAVFALASTYEGFGNVLVEALSCGTAVVSTDCPVGPREILEDGRWGRLVPVGDAAAMARALQAALDSPGAPAGAVAHAQRFTDTAAGAAWRALLDTLPARGAGTRGVAARAAGSATC